MSDVIATRTFAEEFAGRTSEEKQAIQNLVSQIMADPLAADERSIIVERTNPPDIRLSGLPGHSISVLWRMDSRHPRDVQVIFLGIVPSPYDELIASANVVDESKGNRDLISPKDLIERLMRRGWASRATLRSHTVLTSPGGSNRIVIPLGRPMSKRTARKVLAIAGIDDPDFMKGLLDEPPT